jgi:hypothetical protein
MPKPYDPNEGYSRVGAASNEESLDFTEMTHNNDGSLGESLIMGPARSDSLPVTAATAMMQVTAPATLPEGYQFDAQIGDRVVQITVPAGGVEQGQSFSVPLPETVESLITGKGIRIPVGHWRDGLFDIFHYGLCHPAAWSACCCHLCKSLILMQ